MSKLNGKFVFGSAEQAGNVCAFANDLQHAVTEGRHFRFWRSNKTLFFDINSPAEEDELKLAIKMMNKRKAVGKR